MLAEKAEYPITLMARILCVSRSGLHSWLSGGCPEEGWSAEREAVGRVWPESDRRFGARFVKCFLPAEFSGLTLYRVRELMRGPGIRGCTPNRRKRTAIPDPEAEPGPDPVRRDFTSPVPTYRLVGDITYLRTGEGRLHLATVIDLNTRMVVGWSLSGRMTADIAVAALESGVITPSTTILDRGIYDYYSSPQPRCWIYSSYGSTHGRVDVSEAITVSCNYFFYEVGRLTGIKTLDDYATQFGLGQYTGIEIGGPNSAEAKGALASPEYAEANDLEWSDGQTLTAAIGQSYNLFTPLQLANYIATLVGNGEHYAAHLLKNVKTYNNSAVVYAYDKDPVNVVEMQDSTVEAIKTGMHDLTTGSLSTYFSKCVVSAGAKTGTAETGVTDANNGTFVCFAPYDDPQIAVAVVIEKGGAGAALAETAVDILNAYFSREEIGTAIIGENTLLN